MGASPQGGKRAGRKASMSALAKRAVIDSFAKLTPREQQVLERIVAGRLNKQIADDLGISIKTVEAHRASIMDKTNSGTVADLMRVVMDTSQPAKFLDGSQAAK